MSENTATQTVPDESENQRKIVVEARVREVIKNQCDPMRVSCSRLKVSPEFLAELDQRVTRLVLDAAIRCVRNKRATLKMQDV